jgi:uncharacterized protein (TIRG00374 family)
VLARGVDVEAFVAGLETADRPWVGVALATVVATTAAKVGRWRWLFPEDQRPGLLRLGRALLVGQMANALLPARLGDVVRAYLIGQGEGISKATALGTIAAEKTFDVLFLLICAGLTAVLASLPAWLDISLATLALLGLSIFLLAVLVPEEAALVLVERWSRAIVLRAASLCAPLARHAHMDVADRLRYSVQRGLQGLAGLRSPRKALAVCGWSLLIWSLALSTNYVLFRAFHLELSLGAALLLLTLLHAGMAPPSSPARLGVFHALTVVGLETLEVDRAVSLAYAVVLHALVYAPQIVLGGLALALSREVRAEGR